MFSYVVGGVIVAILLAAVSPPARRFFNSLGSWGGTQLDNAAEQVSKTDPLGQYKSKINTAVENGRKASQVVDRAAKQLVSLQNQIAEDLKDQQRLTTRLRAVLQNNDPNNTAEKYALDLEKVERNLVTNQGQLAICQQDYDDNLSMVEKYENEVAIARKDADHMGFQLEQSAAEKNLYQMTAGLKDDLNLGELAAAKRRVQDQIDSNRGAAKGARDLSRQGFAEDADEDLERSQRAKEILARFQKEDSHTNKVASIG